MSELTRILSELEDSEAHPSEQLLPYVYDELRRLAASKLIQEKPGQTLQATALVHEAFLRLVDVENRQSWESRGHFFAAASEAMRRILVEQARRKKSLKAGGQLNRVELAPQDLADDRDIDIIAIDDALRTFEESDPRAAQVVKLRFFGGLTIQQAAETLGVSPATADNDWSYARSWLRLRLAESD